MRSLLWSLAAASALVFATGSRLGGSGQDHERASLAGSARQQHRASSHHAGRRRCHRRSLLRRLVPRHLEQLFGLYAEKRAGDHRGNTHTRAGARRRNDCRRERGLADPARLIPIARATTPRPTGITTSRLTWRSSRPIYRKRYFMIAQERNRYRYMPHIFRGHSDWRSTTSTYQRTSVDSELRDAPVRSMTSDTKTQASEARRTPGGKSHRHVWCGSRGRTVADRALGRGRRDLRVGERARSGNRRPSPRPPSHAAAPSRRRPRATARFDQRKQHALRMDEAAEAVEVLCMRSG